MLAKQRMMTISAARSIDSAKNLSILEKSIFQNNGSRTRSCEQSSSNY